MVIDGDNSSNVKIPKISSHLTTQNIASYAHARAPLNMDKVAHLGIM